MTPEEERLHKARLAKRAKALRQQGTPQRVRPEEFQYVQRIVRKARESGMSYRQMAEQLDQPSLKTTLSKIGRDQSVTVSRGVFDLVRRLQPEPPSRKGWTRRGGSQVSAVGSTRRLQALIALGWTAKDARPYLTIAQRNFSSISRGEVGFVYAVTRRDIADAYDKMQSIDPPTGPEAKKARNRARDRRWAPPIAWEGIDIDDPDAFPEWTGVCGTEDGYRVHLRETLFGGAYMPPCGPCKASAEVGDPAVRRKFPIIREHLVQAMDDSPLTGRQIGAQLYGGESRAKAGWDIIYRWRDGSRQPRSLGLVERLAAILDVDLDYLLDMKLIEVEDSAPRFKPGDFNPFVLRAALDLAGLSFHKAAMLPGCPVSFNALNTWASGTSKPSKPSKIQFLADHFGVDASIFFFS